MDLQRRGAMVTGGLVLLLSCVSAQTACVAAKPPAPPGPREAAKTVAAGNNAFAAELYGKLRTEAKGNLFFSPYSISTALAMVHAGAAGQTQTEIADVLHLTGSLAEVNAGYDGLTEYLRDGSKAGGYQLSVANALWGQRNYGFLAGYINALQQSYGANLFDVDFVRDPEASRQRINGWVAEHTKEPCRGCSPAGGSSPPHSAWRSLPWSAWGSRPISSRNRMPWCAAWKSPAFACWASVKAPRS